MKVNTTNPLAMTSVADDGKIPYLPVREMIWPEPIDAISRPAMSGSVAKPELVGLRPNTICRLERKGQHGAEHPETDQDAEDRRHRERTRLKSASGMIASCFM